MEQRLHDEWDDLADKIYSECLDQMIVDPMQIAPLGKLQIRIAKELRTLSEKYSKAERTAQIIEEWKENINARKELIKKRKDGRLGISVAHDPIAFEYQALESRICQIKQELFDDMFTD